MADVKPTRKQATISGVRQFVVGQKGDPGVDFTYDYIEQLAVDMAKWFKAEESGMTYEDPMAMAKQRIKECLLGLKNDGTVWTTASPDFDKRIKMKCNYIIAAKRGVPVKKVRRKIDPKAIEGAKAVGKMLPAHAQVNVTETRLNYIRDILKVFPELDNPAHLPNVESLADIYAQRKVISYELELGVNANQRGDRLNDLKTIEQMADSMMNKLGIHPNQVRKKVSDDANSSVADLVAQISEDEDFKKREKQWALQLALQLWWMSEHHNYARDGANVADFEIFHLTRSRPVRFKCSCSRETVLVEGFEPHELRDWLVKEGVLVEVPVLPQLHSESDLAGLASFIPEA